MNQHCNLMNRTESAPEQLERSEHHNKVERLHIEGKSNQAQEGKHSHWEVKPGQARTESLAPEIRVHSFVAFQ